MDTNHKLWNEQHQKLNRALTRDDRDTAMQLFMDQHAMVHSATVSRTRLHSFEEELIHDMTDGEIRQIPLGGEHSVAWILFHLARIEDITMNMLVAGRQQIFTRDDWAKKMNASVVHSGNKMDNASIAELSAKVNIKSLHAYRIAVGKRTREIVKNLQAKDFKKKIEPARIEKVRGEGAVTPAAMEIINYWSKKSVGGLLLMPPTRHCILHLNEAMKVKKKVQRR